MHHPTVYDKSAGEYYTYTEGTAGTSISAAAAAPPPAAAAAAAADGYGWKEHRQISVCSTLAVGG